MLIIPLSRKCIDLTSDLWITDYCLFAEKVRQKVFIGVTAESFLFSSGQIKEEMLQRHMRGNRHHLFTFDRNTIKGVGGLLFLSFDMLLLCGSVNVKKKYLLTVLTGRLV